MFNLFKSAPKAYENLSGSDFKNKFKETPKAKLLDVRTAGEFASGNIPGAVNLDISSSKFQQALNTLDKDTTYFVYCRSGNRSGMACELLAKKGLKAYNLSGGIGAWPR